MSKNEIKNVNRKQCVGIMFIIIIPLLTLLIPITFGSAGMLPAYKALPILDKTDLVKNIVAFNFSGLVGIVGNESMVNLLSTITTYGFTGFYAILALDFVVALVLLITGSQILRKIARIFSVITATLFLILGVLFLLNVVSFVLCITNGTIPPENLSVAVEKSGVLSFLVASIFSFLYGGKKYKWFEKLYDDRENNSKDKKQKNKKDKKNQSNEEKSDINIKNETDKQTI